MIAAAQIALAPWGGKVVRLISHRENAVFETRLENGERAALRLHRPGYNSAAEIRSELWWTGQLAQNGFPAPAPIRTKTDEVLVELPDGQLASLIRWAEGAQIGKADEPLSGTLTEQVALYRNLGTLLARLHTTSDALSLPAEFQRRDLNHDGFLGPDPHWGRFWENPALDTASRTLIDTARKAAGDALSAYAANGADTGLIHADALRENVFCDGKNLSLIDFDDSGFGFRLYDLTVALSQSVDDGNFADLRDAMFDGYASIRPLRQTDIDHLPLFILLRRFASFGWVVPRLAPDDPRHALYLTRVKQAAQRYLAGEKG